MRGFVMVYDALHKKYRCIGPEQCGASENPASTHSGDIRVRSRAEV